MTESHTVRLTQPLAAICQLVQVVYLSGLLVSAGCLAVNAQWMDVQVVRSEPAPHRIVAALCSCATLLVCPRPVCCLGYWAAPDMGRPTPTAPARYRLRHTRLALATIQLVLALTYSRSVRTGVGDHGIGVAPLCIGYSLRPRNPAVDGLTSVRRFADPCHALLGQGTNEPLGSERFSMIKLPVLNSSR